VAVPKPVSGHRLRLPTCLFVRLRCLAFSPPNVSNWPPINKSQIDPKRSSRHTRSGDSTAIPR